MLHGFRILPVAVWRRSQAKHQDNAHLLEYHANQGLHRILGLRANICRVEDLLKEPIAHSDLCLMNPKW